MPHKYNAERRHHIPRARYKVTNWSAYEAGLRQRGSLLHMFTKPTGIFINPTTCASTIASTSRGEQGKVWEIGVVRDGVGR